MKAKKILCMLVAGIMLLSAASCGQKKEASTDDGLTELSVFAFDFEGVAEDTGYIVDQLQEKTGVKIKLVDSNFNNWEERLGILIASEDIPDIFITKGLENREVYYKWMKDGILLPISDYVDAAKYPNIQKALDRFSDLTALQEGKHYSIPIQNNLSGNSGAHALYIRTDWLEAVGMDMPTTIDEFYEVAKAFREKDPDKSGQQDTYGLCTNGIWWLYPIFNAFNTSFERFQKVGDTWEPEAISDNMKEAVTFLNKCYKEKLIDPDFMSVSEDKKIENFISGRVGMIIHNAEGRYTELYDKFKAAYPDEDPKDKFSYLTTALEGPDGTKRVDTGLDYWCATAIRSNLEPEKIDKALGLLEYLLSDEGSRLMMLGEEGVDYKVEDGKYISTLPTDENGELEDLSEVHPASKIRNLVAWTDEKYLPDNMRNKEDYMNASKAFAEAAYQDPLVYVNVSTDVVDSAEIKQIKDAVYEGLAKIITQSEDVEKDFETYVQNWKDVGGEKYRTAINEAAKEAGY